MSDDKKMIKRNKKYSDMLGDYRFRFSQIASELKNIPQIFVYLKR